MKALGETTRESKKRAMWDQLCRREWYQGKKQEGLPWVRKTTKKWANEWAARERKRGPIIKLAMTLEKAEGKVQAVVKRGKKSTPTREVGMGSRKGKKTGQSAGKKNRRGKAGTKKRRGHAKGEHRSKYKNKQKRTPHNPKKKKHKNNPHL